MIARSRVFLALIPFLLLILMAGCAKQHTVQAKGESLIFLYRDDKAREVILATSQDNFAYHPAQKEKSELWIVHLPYQSEFSYFYLVDGQVKLPECQNTVLDDFGGKNCFYEHAL